MPRYRVRQVADLLGVSDDTVRRWADAGRLPATRDASGRVTVEGADLAAFVDDLAQQSAQAIPKGSARLSASNRLPGLVTRVDRDGVMAQVEIRSGPFRLVSIMTSEAAFELNLTPGALAVAAIIPSAVVVEVPPGAEA